MVRDVEGLRKRFGLGSHPSHAKLTKLADSDPVFREWALSIMERALYYYHHTFKMIRFALAPTFPTGSQPKGLWNVRNRVDRALNAIVQLLPGMRRLRLMNTEGLTFHPQVLSQHPRSSMRTEGCHRTTRAVGLQSERTIGASPMRQMQAQAC